MAWLLIIFFQPIVGLIVYLLIGDARLPRRRIKRRALHRLEMLHNLAAQSPHVVHPVIDAQHEGIIRMAEKLGEFPILAGNAVELITDTRVTIDRVIEDVNQAQHHVHMTFYIFQPDDTGKRVAEALVRAAGRGVRCRLLADAVGSRPLFASGLAQDMIARGVDVRPMLPVNPLRRRLARLDLRNHRKLVVIDGQVAYTGSQNITHPLYGTKRLPWVEIMSRLTGPVVMQLQAVFLEDWYFDTDEICETPDIFPPVQTAGDVPVQVIPSGPTYPTENYHRFAIAAIHAAQKRLTITTPYLVPDEPLMYALQVACLRGVHVDLIVPLKSDQPLTSAAGRAYYEDLLDWGVHLYLHTEGLLHTKAMSVDGLFAMFGSGNFDNRSFFLNFELNLLLYGDKITQQIREIQEDYMRHSVALELARWRHRPLVRRFADEAAGLLGPLL
jgi:cardiolipin synthase